MFCSGIHLAIVSEKLTREQITSQDLTNVSKRHIKRSLVFTLLFLYAKKILICKIVKFYRFVVLDKGHMPEHLARPFEPYMIEAFLFSMPT